MTRVAVIGAGLAGLHAARRLHDAGAEVRVFDKARGSGGRMSTRRTDFGAFDHGAQYFTARDPRFRAQVEKWVASGAAAPWPGKVVRLAEGSPVREPSAPLGHSPMSPPVGVRPSPLTARAPRRRLPAAVPGTAGQRRQPVTSSAVRCRSGSNRLVW